MSFPNSSALEMLLAACRNRSGEQPLPASGGWRTNCPVHDDAHNSLQIDVDSSGRVELRCPQGCAAAQIVAALGLSLTDLEPAGNCADTQTPDFDAVNGGLGVSVTPACANSGGDDGYGPFPVDALPPRIRMFVVNAAEALGCPAEFLAVPLLPVLGSAIGNTRRLQLKAGFTVPPVIWSTVIGEPGTLKSPAYRVILKPVWDVQSQAYGLFTEKLQRHQRRLEAYKRKLRQWSLEPSGAPPVEPTGPELQRVVVVDATIEALAPLLARNPRGLLLAAEELDGWLRGFDRPGAGRAHWLQLFDGSTLIVDRKTGAEHLLSIPMAAVCMAGTTQPGSLRRALASRERECGLAGRLLFAMPPRQPKRWTDQAVLPECEAEYASILERLRELPLQMLDGVPEPLIVRMDAEAKRRWVCFYNEHAREQATLSGDLAAAWSKLEGYAARLALVIHLTRWAEQDPTVQSPDVLDQTSMDAGITLARWFANEARRVYIMLDQGNGNAGSGDLLDWIRRRGGVARVNDLTHHLRQFRGNPVLARAALEELRGQGLGQWVFPPPGKAGGRPREEFHLGDETFESALGASMGGQADTKTTVVPTSMKPI